MKQQTLDCRYKHDMHVSHQWELTARRTGGPGLAKKNDSLWPFFLGSLAASTQSCWKSRGKLALSPTRYLQLNPVCPVYQDWSGESSPCLLHPLPPTFKNISWTISTCPHPGQLLLLTNYRLGNPVTHRGFGSSGNRQGFQGTAAWAKGKPQLSGLSS